MSGSLNAIVIHPLECMHACQTVPVNSFAGAPLSPWSRCRSRKGPAPLRVQGSNVPDFCRALSAARPSVKGAVAGLCLGSGFNCLGLGHQGVADASGMAEETATRKCAIDAKDRTARARLEKQAEAPKPSGRRSATLAVNRPNGNPRSISRNSNDAPGQRQVNGCGRRLRNILAQHNRKIKP